MARGAAAARTFLGARGHLATVRSDGERDFLCQQEDFNTTAQYAWLGAAHAEGQPPKPGWSWVTGEDFDYAPWVFGEPNTAALTPPKPQYLTLRFTGDGAGFADHADLTGADRNAVGSYFVDYALPEPAALAPLAAGVLLLARRRRRPEAARRRGAGPAPA